METENDSPDELEIVYPTLSRELAPSRACATDDTVPLNIRCYTIKVENIIPTPEYLGEPQKENQNSPIRGRV